MQIDFLFVWAFRSKSRHLKLIEWWSFPVSLLLPTSQPRFVPKRSLAFKLLALQEWVTALDAAVIYPGICKVLDSMNRKTLGE